MGIHMKNIFSIVMTTLIFSVAIYSHGDNSIYSFTDKKLLNLDTQKKEEREYWGLSKEEWNTYETIITKTPWATWNHNSTPLALLAFYSNSEQKKIGYARKQAELDEWREAVVIEWQRDYYNPQREAVRAEFRLALDNQEQLKSINNIGKGDTVITFIDIESCGTFCKAQTRKILQSQAKSDFYFMGQPSKDTIFKWAKMLNISVERVRLKEVTLNRNYGQSKKLNIPDEKFTNGEGFLSYVQLRSGIKELL